MEPNLHDIMAYRGIHALCSVSKDNKLTATHYACCLVGGNHPVWAVWTVRGKFLRFYTYKSDIEKAYPNLVWRRKMASWSLRDVSDHTPEQRRAELEKAYGSGEDESKSEDPSENVPIDPTIPVIVEV